MELPDAVFTNEQTAVTQVEMQPLNTKCEYDLMIKLPQEESSGSAKELNNL